MTHDYARMAANSRDGHDFVCDNCGTRFTATRKKCGSSPRRFCTKECRVAVQNTANGSGLKHLPTGTIGAIGELMAAAHLMGMGFECHRALSPSATCDVLAIKGHQVFRFEIRSGYSHPTKGTIHYNIRNVRAENIAVFLHRENKVVLVPEIPAPFAGIAPSVGLERASANGDEFTLPSSVS